MKNLNATFRSLWPANIRDDYQPLNEDDAPAGTPHPYCVFTQDPGRVVDRMSGKTRETSRETHAIPVQFAVHAKKTADRSAKEVARDLIKRIKSHFEWPAVLDFSPDRHITTIIEVPDFPVREGDEEYQWLLLLEYHIDCTLNARPIT